MKPLFTRNDTSLTADFLTAYYADLYNAVHGEKPRCEHLQERWFLVNGIQRDRRWLILEIELLRQRLITAGVENQKKYPVRRLLRMIYPQR